MQGLDLGTADVGAMQTLQATPPARESDPSASTHPGELADSTESFRATLRNEMSAEAAATTQAKTNQSAREMAAQGTSKQATIGEKTTDTAAAAALPLEAGQIKAGRTDVAQSEPKLGAAKQTAAPLNATLDTAATAKAVGQAATRTDAANLLSKSYVDLAARADAAARGAANSASGEKTTAKAKHEPQATEASHAAARNAEGAPVTVAAAPVVAVAVPVLAVQSKPADDEGSDASGSVAAVGTKRARRTMANQIEAGAAKTANAKTAQADGQAADAGAAASASKDAKLASAAEAGQAIASAVAAQAGMQTHGGSLQPAADALGGIAVQGSGVAAVGAVAGSHARDGVSAANGGAVGGGAEASLPGHRILSAGPTQLEVGVMDGTHGWLQIRAELGAGGAINTSLTGSATAHAPLQQSVPEMTSYLASESVSVSGIAVHKASETAGTMAWGQGQSEGQAAGGAGTSGRGGSPTQDGGAVMDGAHGPGGGRGGSATQDGRAVADGAPGPIGLGWLGGVSPAVFAGGFSGGGASLATGTGSWLSVRV